MKVASILKVSTLNHILDITTFTVYLIACNLKMYFISRKKTVVVKRHRCFPIYEYTVE